MRSDRVDGATLDLSERSTALAVKSSDTARDLEACLIVFPGR